MKKAYFGGNLGLNDNYPWLKFNISNNGEKIRVSFTDLGINKLGLAWNVPFQCRTSLGSLKAMKHSCFDNLNFYGNASAYWSEISMFPGQTRTLKFIPGHTDTDVPLYQTEFPSSQNQNLVLAVECNSSLLAHFSYLWRTVVPLEKVQMNYFKNKSPSAPENLHIKSAEYITESDVRLKLSWTCPSTWNGRPSHYRINCLNLKYDFSSFYTLAYGTPLWTACIDYCYKTLDHSNCTFCWERMSYEAEKLDSYRSGSMFLERVHWNRYKLEINIGKPLRILTSATYEKPLMSDYDITELLSMPNDTDLGPLKIAAELNGSVVVCSIQAVSNTNFSPWSPIVATRISSTANSANSEIIIEETISNLTLGKMKQEMTYGNKWELFRIGSSGFIENATNPSLVFSTLFGGNSKRKGQSLPLQLFWDNDVFHISNPTRIIKVDLDSSLIEHPTTDYSVSLVRAKALSRVETLLSSFFGIPGAYYTKREIKLYCKEVVRNKVVTEIKKNF